jgi:hypothetical protein
MIAKPVRSRAEFTIELRDFITHSPHIFGAADILNFDYLDPLERAGILAAILTGLATADHRPAVRAVVVIAPPETEISTADSRTWSAMLAASELLHGRKMPADAQAWLKGRFKVVSVPDLSAPSLLTLIAEQPEHAAVIVTDAAKYRRASVEPHIDPSNLTALLPEDVWVPQVHALATSAVQVAQDRKLYVALDTGQLSPRRPTLCDLLISVDGCGVMGSSEDQDLWTLLNERIGRWGEWIREGYLGKVLREIEELPPTFDGNKRFLRIQMLHRAGSFNESLQAIREELISRRNIDASSRVKLARIAENAGASRLAWEILSPAVDQLDTMEDLESALVTAYDAGYRELEERVAARLARLFPHSPGVRARKKRIMAATRDYNGIAEMLMQEENDQARANFFRELARFLSTPETPNYVALIASAGGDRARSDAFRTASVQDALQRGLIVHAFELALPLPETPQELQRGESLLAKVLEAVFLSGTKGIRPVSDERVQAAVLALVKRLSADPTNVRLRMRLASLVQPSVCGTGGLALMAAVALELASRPITLKKRAVAAEVQIDWIPQHQPFVDAASVWLKAQERLVIGRVVLPNTLLTESPDEAVSAVTKYLSYAPVTDTEDVNALKFWLTFATSVAPHGTDPDRDIQLMRLVAGKLASSGYMQVARDLAEQTLLNSAASPRRRRLGWFAMADVYHRCHNYLEGLIALACALATDEAVDEEQAWYETNMLARLMRDCRLYDLARAAIAKSRKHLARMSLTDANGHRLDTIELQIRQREFDGTGASNAELEALIEDAVQNGAVVIERNDETAPAALV